MTPARAVRTGEGSSIAVPVPAGIANGAAVTSRSGRSARVFRATSRSDGLALRGTVRQVLYLGATREFHLDLDGGERGIVEMPNDGSAVPFDAGAAVWLARVVRELPRAAGAILKRSQTSAGAGRKTALSAMIGTSPSSVVRCIRRRYFASSNGVAQCCVQRLSHSSASPTRHLWR